VSLEKKPVVKVSPISLIRHIIRDVTIAGVEFTHWWYFRKSCIFSEVWITDPTFRNSSLLNTACLAKCNRARGLRFILVHKNTSDI
jgi:hypothetical protein